MTHVSRAPIKSDVFDQITSGLIWVLTDISRESEMKSFFNDFFTKTERLMLAKRLSIGLMIVKGYDTELIAKILRVSTATVYRMRGWVERGDSGLQMAFNKLVKREKMDAFWKKIDDFAEDWLFKPSLLPKLSRHK